MDITEYIMQIEQQRKEQDSLYHNVAVKYGLSETAMWVLYLASEDCGDLTQQDLCRRSCYAKQTINTAVNSLVKHGLLELIPIQGTRNHKKIRLTPAGWNLANSTTRNLKSAEERAYSRLTEEELRTYLDITSRLTAYFREETEQL